MRLSHDWMPIDAFFRSLLQVSWNRSLGRPLDLGPPKTTASLWGCNHASSIQQTGPSQQMALIQEHENGGQSGVFKHVHVRDPVLPPHAKYASEAAQMETIQLLDIL